MSTTIDKISPELQLPDPNKPQIRKAFNFLKSHASVVANFTLQWQDLEDHLHSINNSIQSKLFEIQQSKKTPDTQLPKTLESQPPSSKKEQLSQTLESQFDSKETQLNTPKTQVKTEESAPVKAGLNAIPVHDGNALIVYLKKNLKDHESIREDLRDALKGLEDSGKVVIEAIKGFHQPELKTGVVNSELSAVRRCCVLLLEELIKVRPLINSQVKEEARELASVWKTRMKLEMVNSMEVWGYLLLLDAFGLVGEYDRDEILSLVGSVVQRRQAPEMFRSLGLSDKASDFTQNLIAQNKQLEAIRFIYAFELVDKFPPVPLLKAYLKEAKKVARTVLKMSKSSPKEKDDATNREIAALRIVIRCIEEHKLESEYSPENLKERIEWLKRQKEERNSIPAGTAPKVQVQQQSGQKRTFHDSKSQMKKQQQNRSKNPRTTAVPAAPNLSARAPITVHSMHHHSAGLFEGERMEYLIPSARVAAPSNVSARAAAIHAMHHRVEGLFEGDGTEYLRTSARMVASAAAAPASDPNPSIGATSNSYSTEPSRYQSAASYIGQGTQYSSRYYNVARSILDSHTSLPSESHRLVGSPPATQQMNLTSGAYSLSSYIPETHHMSSAHYGLTGSGAVTAHVNSSAEQYGSSSAASGRTGQFGSAGAAQAAGVTSNGSPRTSLAYYPGDPLRIPGYNDRPVSSSSGYEVLSNRPHVFHI